jgi:hypothetical protein
MISVPHRKHTYGAQKACQRDSFTFLCVNDVRTSQEISEYASMAYYGNSFIFIYVDDIYILGRAHLLDHSACYRDSFTFYV